MINTLRQHAITAANRAYSPYSEAKVGSAVLTTNDQIYSGCNIENSSFGATICAERSAIAQMISKQGKAHIDKVYIYTRAGWPPCGLCRQVISEFATPSTEIIIGNEEGEEKHLPFSDLFPLGYTAEEYQKNKTI
ncbi:cytidine deaminase [Piscirickettsia litoralis]|uniref:Cytidine deaminase n=1 Tax=Piscirickettsia litoralis TaxID=1891921 RepID=A0ABX3A450_9GAMM|nr:cytidine deaminase [Piscirickettsia litoralis]ODN43647.1 cytidine deaminase [Piscirickettsia litoralis]